MPCHMPYRNMPDRPIQQRKAGPAQNGLVGSWEGGGGAESPCQGDAAHRVSGARHRLGLSLHRLVLVPFDSLVADLRARAHAAGVSDCSSPRSPSTQLLSRVAIGSVRGGPPGSGAHAQSDPGGSLEQNGAPTASPRPSAAAPPTQRIMEPS
eukprot:352949-Chlamydomonas_euryale.AAC.12